MKVPYCVFLLSSSEQMLLGTRRHWSSDVCISELRAASSLGDILRVYPSLYIYFTVPLAHRVLRLFTSFRVQHVPCIPVVFNFFSCSTLSILHFEPLCNFITWLISGIFSFSRDTHLHCQLVSHYSPLSTFYYILWIAITQIYTRLLRYEVSLAIV